jgi:hypothetical protein
MVIIPFERPIANIYLFIDFRIVGWQLVSPNTFSCLPLFTFHIVSFKSLREMLTINFSSFCKCSNEIIFLILAKYLGIELNESVKYI